MKISNQEYEEIQIVTEDDGLIASITDKYIITEDGYKVVRVPVEKKGDEDLNEKKEQTSLYEKVVEELSLFVIRAAGKDNPTDAELNAMVEITKILFRTI